VAYDRLVALREAKRLLPDHIVLFRFDIRNVWIKSSPHWRDEVVNWAYGDDAFTVAEIMGTDIWYDTDRMGDTESNEKGLPTTSFLETGENLYKLVKAGLKVAVEHGPVIGLRLMVFTPNSALNQKEKP